MNNEDRELRTRVKKKGACRVYLNRFTRNIYYIDLIDFSSKQNKWIQSQFKDSATANFNKNRGYKYVLVCIDGYSRYLMTRLLKSKDAKTVSSAMQDIIKYYGAPHHINCDQGSEFVNAIFKKSILEKFDIKMYHMHSDTGSESTRKYYYWELLKSKCKPTTKSIIQTRKQSEKNPENLIQAARTHRPVTRAMTKTKTKTKTTAQKRRK